MSEKGAGLEGAALACFLNLHAPIDARGGGDGHARCHARTERKRNYNRLHTSVNTHTKNTTCELSWDVARAYVFAVAH